MKLEVRQVTEVTDSLLEAFGRLMPQLSPRLEAPSGERLRAVAANPSAALFTAESGGAVVGALTLVWYDVPSGRKAWIEDVVVDAAARGFGAGGRGARARGAGACRRGRRREGDAHLQPFARGCAQTVRKNGIQGGGNHGFCL